LVVVRVQDVECLDAPNRVGGSRVVEEHDLERVPAALVRSDRPIARDLLQLVDPLP
jgi:hypothetical protein